MILRFFCVWWHIKQKRDWSVLWGEGQGWRVGTLRQPIRASAAPQTPGRQWPSNGSTPPSLITFIGLLLTTPIPFSNAFSLKHMNTHTPTQRLGHFFSGDNYLTSFTDRDKKGTEGKRKNEADKTILSEVNSLTWCGVVLRLCLISPPLQINPFIMGDLWSVWTPPLMNLIN